MAVLISNISYFSYKQPTYVGWFFNASFAITAVVLLPRVNKYATKNQKNYIFLMLLGFLLHLFVSNIDNRVYDVAKWILPVVLLIASRKYDSRIVIYSLLLFFVFHCLIAINESITQEYFVDYFYTDEFGQYNEIYSQFRAFGLMAHPLYGANVLLIIMSFLLVSKNMNKYLKVSLLLLGSYALTCFNSRAAMIIWGAILVYRLLLYKRKPFFAISFGVIIYLLFISDLFSLLLQSSSGFLGRLGEADSLNDSSSITRLVSFAVFAGEDWTFYDIVAGGRIFYLPGTKLSLENGLLLTIAWWGWIVGVLKVILELVISWKCLVNYDKRDRIIIIVATWVCAYTNNNTVNTFVFVFFIICFIAMKYYSKERNIANKYNYKSI
jgi:hypothetical protein